ncbi:MAG TPA: response regulator transcription factor [Candidatus Xenobia bacterium]|nr:response regulator transcription factor [Candidatus Xenobia bacterium]
MSATHEPETDSKTARLRVLIADDSALFLRTLSLLLQDQPGLEVVGMANGGKQAIDLMESLKPDLVLMDLNMPDLSGLAVLQYARENYPSTRIIVVSSYDTPTVMAACRARGANGFVSKNRLSTELLGEIRRAAEQIPHP